jgi:hypothetical protein
MLPISRCECAHLAPAHIQLEGSCQKRRGRGFCGCEEFRPSEAQIYADTYNTLASFSMEFGYTPTVRELGKAMGLSSPSTIQERLKVIEDAGLIERVGVRAIKIMEVEQ